MSKAETNSKHELESIRPPGDAPCPKCGYFPTFASGKLRKFGGRPDVGFCWPRLRLCTRVDV